MMKTIHEKYVDAMYHPVLRAVVIKWKDYASPEQYKDTIEKAYELAIEHQCSNWISDMAMGKAVSNETTKWLRTEFIPRMAKDGRVRKMAIYLNKNPFRKLFVEAIKEDIQMSGIQFKIFESQLDLERWIKGDLSHLFSHPAKAEKTVYSHFY